MSDYNFLDAILARRSAFCSSENLRPLLLDGLPLRKSDRSFLVSAEWDLPN